MKINLYKNVISILRLMQLCNNICFLQFFQNLTDCQEKYRDAPRGPSCYCTTFHGCFKKHFYVKPYMNKLGAFSITGKGQGVGNTEYYMEVTVVNKALLKTVVVTKVEIDIP
jgi:hypothetical protein